MSTDFVIGMKSTKIMTAYHMEIILLSLIFILKRTGMVQRCLDNNLLSSIVV